MSMSLTDEEISKLYNTGVRLLSRREHSVKELYTKLRSRLPSHSNGDVAIEAVIERLSETGYLSDERFAMVYARSRAMRGFGADRIALELADKGISSDFQEVVLAELEAGWPALIFNVWRKKYGKRPEDFTEKNKQMTFLRYRGFRAEDVRQLFSQLDSSVQDATGLSVGF
ncbi:regulatory protein RecX [Teredinibacter waterburyi]|jgi:Uncharacterized protein conserved in bacteria|uniref:regulatory protein RecX n=1 Tax=Teredinibacter waterburyi TaxID=1500538 RepID=UPI00165F91DA|nr:regulatory protein RecX [Teredinibacter waterburyi]